MRAVKWIVIVLGSLLGLVIVAVGTVYGLAGRRIARHYEVAGTEVTLPTDSAALARGKTLSITRGCTGCHTADLGGNGCESWP